MLKTALLLFMIVQDFQVIDVTAKAGVRCDLLKATTLQNQVQAERDLHSTN